MRTTIFDLLVLPHSNEVRRFSCCIFHPVLVYSRQQHDRIPRSPQHRSLIKGARAERSATKALRSDLAETAGESQTLYAEKMPVAERRRGDITRVLNQTRSRMVSEGILA